MACYYHVSKMGMCRRTAEKGFVYIVLFGLLASQNRIDFYILLHSSRASYFNLMLHSDWSASQSKKSLKSRSPDVQLMNESAFWATCPMYPVTDGQFSRIWVHRGFFHLASSARLGRTIEHENKHMLKDDLDGKNGNDADPALVYITWQHILLLLVLDKCGQIYRMRDQHPQNIGNVVEWT